MGSFSMCSGFDKEISEKHMVLIDLKISDYKEQKAYYENIHRNAD